MERRLILAELEKSYNEVQEYAQSQDMMEFTGLQEELNYAVDEVYYAIITNDDATIEEIKAATVSIKEFIAEAKAGVVFFGKLKSLFIACNDLLQTTAYPGQDALAEAISIAQGLVDNFNKIKYAEIEKGIKDLEAARMIYYYSQEASADKPADYTFLITASSFYNPDCGISKEEANNDNRSVWGTSENWINGSIRNGGDFRPGYKGGRTCWNSWSNNFTSMDIHQDLVNLPEGYYSLKCYGQAEGGITDQHAYIKTTAGTEKSPVMTNELGAVPEGWEELVTEKIAVVDGKLTIGFASTSGGDVKGWFSVTDFSLYYYGVITESDYKAVLDERVVKAQSLTSYLKGDRKALEGALVIAARAVTADQIIEALDTLSTAVAIIEASNAAYEKFLLGDLATAKANAEFLSGSSQEIMDAIIAKVDAYLVTDIATSEKMMGIYAPALTNYNSYLTALIMAETTISTPPTGYIESTLADLNTIMAEQKMTLVNNVAGKETIDWFVTYLNKAIMAVNIGKYLQEAKAVGSNYDMTGIIMNADAAAKDGWAWLSLADGPLKSGQYYDADQPDHKYFDSWNGTNGKLKLTAYQELDYLPNGNYTLKVAARSSCEKGGALLFVTAKDNENIAVNDTIWQSIICNWDKGGSIWETAVANNPESGEALVNGGLGYGWNWHEFTFDVKDHKASIGMSTDSLITHKPFTGTWFSVVDFQLIMNTWAADNDDNFGWVTGMDIPITDDLVPMVIKTDNKVISVTNAATGETVKNYKVFTVTGTEVNPVGQQNTGIYVVKVGQQIEKILVK